MSLSDELSAVINEYYEVEKRKNHIEGKTAYVITNTKYLENVRHAMSHLMAGLKLQDTGVPADDPRAKEQFVHARKHIRDLDINGYEYLAGYLLTQVRKCIEGAGLYLATGRAEAFRQEALAHFNRGRDLRTSDKNTAMAQFELCVDKCQQGLREIGPISPLDKRAYKIALWSLLVGATGAILAVIALLIKP